MSRDYWPLYLDDIVQSAGRRKRSAYSGLLLNCHQSRIVTSKSPAATAFI